MPTVLADVIQNGLILQAGTCAPAIWPLQQGCETGVGENLTFQRKKKAFGEITNNDLELQRHLQSLWLWTSLKTLEKWVVICLPEI